MNAQIITFEAPMRDIPPVTSASVCEAIRARDLERLQNGIVVNDQGRVIVAPAPITVMPRLPNRALFTAPTLQDDVDALVEEHGLARVREALRKIEEANGNTVEDEY